MIELSLKEIAELTQGTLAGSDAVITGSVVTDSREIAPGSLYVARVGEHADGHDFVQAAMADGAAGVLGLRQVDGEPAVLVKDPDIALGQVARGVVDRAPNLAIVGITGSSGKTSTKDLLGSVLSRFAPTIAPYGSLNSEVGVPLTVCRVTSDTRYLVAEMGASGVGHIQYLTQIAPPSIGIVLNVGKAHMGEFGSVEAIAQTKGELVEALPSDGFAILNADDALVRAMAPRTKAKVILVGRSAEASYRATDITLDADGRASYTLVCPQGEFAVHLAVVGDHQVGNSLSVIAAAACLGHDVADIVDALAEAKAGSRWRMEVHHVRDDITLVNDAYNANPDSMAAAVRALAHMGDGPRRIAVLGEMLELGESSRSEHETIGRQIAEQGIDEVVAIGLGAAPIADGALAAGMSDEAIHRFGSTDEARAFLATHVAPGDILLFKSSRDSGLRVLGDTLEQDFAHQPVSASEVTS